MTDTLIVCRDGKNIIERYQGQSLDEYDYIAEFGHGKLLDAKALGYWYMSDITIKDIMDYLKQFG